MEDPKIEQTGSSDASSSSETLTVAGLGPLLDFIRTGLRADVEREDKAKRQMNAQQWLPGLHDGPSGAQDSDFREFMTAIGQRSDMTNVLMRLGGEGEGDVNKIVLELINTTCKTEPTSLVKQVSENLMGVLRTQTLVDAGIIMGNERYHCFKSVLQSYATVYAAKLFMEKLTESYLPEQVPTAGSDQIGVVRMVADEILQVPELLRQLKAALEKMEFFNEDTAFKVYLETRHYPQAKILRELMLTRISRVFLCIVSSSTFLDFSEQELLHMLRHCYLSVNSEIEVFLAVILWLEHNWFERKNHIQSVMSGVRVGLLPTWYLSTLEKTNGNTHFARVIYLPYMQELLAKGFEDALSLGAKQRTQTNGLMQRDWIVDSNCRHHHKRHCERFVYPTYEVFKAYLADIYRGTPNYWRKLRPAQEVYRNELKCCLVRPAY